MAGKRSFRDSVGATQQIIFILETNDRSGQLPVVQVGSRERLLDTQNGRSPDMWELLLTTQNGRWKSSQIQI